MAGNGNGASVLEDFVFGLPGQRRFTQDSPVMPEVWTGFADHPDERGDLLLTPHRNASAARLMKALAKQLLDDDLGEDTGEHGLAYNEGYVVAWIDLRQLVRFVVPLSAWWQRVWPPRAKKLSSWVGGLDLEELAAAPAIPREGDFRLDWLLWYLTLIGRIELIREGEEDTGGDRIERWREELASGAKLLDGVKPPRPDQQPLLWSVNVNRVARTALYESRRSVKADAAERVFAAGTGGLRWAIVDSGVDATHPAFRRRDPDGALEDVTGKDSATCSRVVATYDFTRLRPIVSGRQGDLSAEQRGEIERRVTGGQALDWDALRPLLEIPHDSYTPPTHPHGTHVAGIVGGDWRSDDAKMPSLNNLIGVCPEIELYDMRVFGPDGRGEEFAIAAALQFIRHLNAHSDIPVIHGANLSFSIPHKFSSYATGRTPICDECERLAASGVVVAAAAGNEGQARYRTAEGTEQDGFRSVAITDPGNAESVITVGATHRRDPHTYGVSYFSSRGPTGDGRAKPDLVAPGEKVSAPVPGEGFDSKEGTSQATAHVSGVAAMLIARHPELQGQPRRVKEILCQTATDLGRERYFQGAGLIDALRALQEV